MYPFPHLDIDEVSFKEFINLEAGEEGAEEEGIGGVRIGCGGVARGIGTVVDWWRKGCWEVDPETSERSEIDWEDNQERGRPALPPSLDVFTFAPVKSDILETV